MFFIVTSARRYCDPSCLLVGLFVRLFVNVFVNVLLTPTISKTIGDRGRQLEAAYSKLSGHVTDDVT